MQLFSLCSIARVRVFAKCPNKPVVLSGSQLSQVPVAGGPKLSVSLISVRDLVFSHVFIAILTPWGSYW